MLSKLVDYSQRAYLHLKTWSQLQVLLISSSHIVVSTLINSGLGSIYWIVAARLYSPQTLGASVALISMMALIALIAPLGLEAALVYSLPDAGARWHTTVNSVLLTIATVAAMLSTIFLLGAGSLNQQAASITTSLFSVCTFIGTCICWTLSLVLDQLLTIERATSLVLLRNTITSSLKLILLPAALLFAPDAAALLIFAGWGLACLLGSNVVVILFSRRKTPIYPWTPEIDLRQVGMMLPSSLGNYLMTVSSVAPSLILPLLITQALSAQQNAYFYTVWMIVNSILYTFPAAVAYTFFAQSRDTQPAILANQVKRLLLLLVLSVTPIMLGLILFREQTLGLFGREYIRNGSGLLVALALSAVPVSLNVLYISLQRIRCDLRRGFIASFGGGIGSLLGSIIFMPLYGLIGVGIGGTVAATIVALCVLVDMRWIFQRTPPVLERTS